MRPVTASDWAWDILAPNIVNRAYPDALAELVEGYLNDALSAITSGGRDKTLTESDIIQALSRPNRIAEHINRYAIATIKTLRADTPAEDIVHLLQQLSAAHEGDTAWDALVHSLTKTISALVIECGEEVTR